MLYQLRAWRARDGEREEVMGDRVRERERESESERVCERERMKVRVRMMVKEG